MEDQPQPLPQAVLLGDCIVEHSTDFNRSGHNINHKDFLQLGRVRNGLGVLLDEAPVGDPLFAFVNIGRWILECDVCNSAVVAESTYPWFTCTACGSGNKWLPVLFPPDKSEIETALLRRPGFRNAAKNRNWTVDETVGDLYLQNAQHGIQGQREGWALMLDATDPGVGE